MTRRIWLIWSSFAMTAFLGVVLAGLVLVAAWVPQGWMAERLAGFEGSETLRMLFSAGLTNVATSWWLGGLLILIVGNFVSVVLRVALSSTASAPLGRDAGAPLESTVTSQAPERTVEAVRNAFATLFGRPTVEKVEGPRVVLVYETAPRARLSPLIAHLGLVMVLVGTALAAQPAPFARSMVRAKLKVKDTQTPSVGIFDMAQDEVKTFFQWPSEFAIRAYTPSKDGLGPAVRIQRTNTEQRRVDEFWVYLDAPEGFDANHRVGLDGPVQNRRGQVVIEALEMGMVPRPGQGWTARPEAILLLAGLGLLVLGVIELGRPDGQLVVDIEGRDLRVAGWPRHTSDARFVSAFPRWTGVAQWAVEEARS